MSLRSMTLPLFEQKGHGSSPTEGLRWSVRDIHNIDPDLSLGRKGSARKTWENTTGNMFVKAKASVDALRNNQTHQLVAVDQSHVKTSRRDEAVSSQSTPRASPKGLAKPGLRATASLNRAIDSARSATRRSSLFGSAVLSSAANAADSPKGPEHFEHDATSSTPPSHRMSFSSIRRLTRDKHPNKDKRSSKQSSPLSRGPEDWIGQRDSGDTDHSVSQVKPPSPVVDAKYSPPPSIRCDLHLSDFLDSDLLEAVGLSEAEFAAAMRTIPEATGVDKPSIRSCSPVNPMEESQQIYLPSRNTTDHWRTSQVRIAQPAPCEMAEDRFRRLIGCPPSKTESILNLDRLLSSDAEDTVEESPCKSQFADANISPMNGAFEPLDESFETRRAKVSAKRRKESVGPTSSHDHHAGHGCIAASVQTSWPLPTNRVKTPPTSVASCGMYRSSHEDASSQDAQLLGETPSPGKTIKLPLRLKRLAPKQTGADSTGKHSVNATVAEASISQPSHAIFSKEQEYAGTKDHEDHLDCDSEDEHLSPLFTQDIFYHASDEDEDNSAYVLRLNDLVEEATRSKGDSGRKVASDGLQQNGSGRGVAHRSDDNTALNTLSDLRRLRPYRERDYRDAMSALGSSKFSRRVSERLRLEREVVRAVFEEEPQDDSADIQSRTSPTVDTERDDDQSTQAQDRRCYTYGPPFTPPRETSISVDQENEVPADTEAVDATSWPWLERADSGCMVPVCPTCGGLDDHVCDVLQVAEAGVQSMGSEATYVVEDRYKALMEILESRGIEIAPKTTPGSTAGQDSGCSLQRKRSDPIGLELNRLTEPGWLHGMSPGSVSRFMVDRTRWRGPSSTKCADTTQGRKDGHRGVLRDVSCQEKA